MKAILVLAMLVVVLHAKSYTMVIRTTASSKPRLVANEDQPLKKQLKPFRDYLNKFYVGNVTIGTPGQTFSLLVDTGMANVWVFDKACRSFACIGIPSRSYTRHTFNTRGSSTFRRSRGSAYLRHGAGGCNGPLATDVVSFAGVTIEQQALVHATEADDVFATVPIDGVLGLGWPALSVGQVTTPLQNLLPSLDAPLFTIWMDRRRASTTGNVGLVTFGSIDTTNCQSEINYVQLSSETFWQFPMEGFSVGSFSRSKDEQVISDSGTAWIGAPTDIISAVVNTTGAKYDTTNHFYTVDCSTRKAQPDLMFTISGVRYNISSDEYVRDVGIGDGQCVLAFFDMSSGGFGATWALGDMWIRSYCNIYDIGQKRIGFAKAIYSRS